MKDFFDQFEDEGELAAFIVGNDWNSKLVEKLRYWRLKKAPQPFKMFRGVKYPWQSKKGEYGRWTIIGGKRVYERLDGAIRRANKRRKAEVDAVLAKINQEIARRKRDGLPSNDPEDILDLNEAFLVPLLKRLGRSIIPDGAYRKPYSEKRKPFVRSLKRINKTGAAVIVLRRKDGLVMQKRLYDRKGMVLQDYDFWHGDGDKTHKFPHIHVYINGVKVEMMLRYRKASR